MYLLFMCCRRILNTFYFKLLLPFCFRRYLSWLNETHFNYFYSVQNNLNFETLRY